MKKYISIFRNGTVSLFRRLSLLKRGAGALVCMIGMAACTHYETPADIAGGTVVATDTTQSIVRRVLWVNIDGARGTVVKQEVENGNLPNIKAMLQHSKYSWTGLSDSRFPFTGDSLETEEDPLTWASMLTGYNVGAHRIHDTSYSQDFEINSDPIDQKITYFPTIVQMLNKENASLKVSCVTPWENLNHYLQDAYSVTTTLSDEDTQNTLLSQLSQEDHSLTIASFKDVLEAGKQGGFKAGNPQYISALKEVDTKLKALLDTINVRKNASLEDWLVIITSNHGGTDEGAYGGTTDADRDIFGIFYYPHYTQFEMEGKTLEAAYLNPGEGGIIPDTMAYYGISRNKGFTVEVGMRIAPKSDGTYNGGNWYRILGKDKWGISRSRNTAVAFRVSQTPSLQEEITSGNDGLCHAYYTGLSAYSGGKRSFVFSYDGMRTLYMDTETTGVENDSTNLTLGRSNLPTPYYMAYVRIWNTTLDDATVDQNASLLEIPANHTYRDHLIGEWILSPDRLSQDSIIQNTIKGMPDLHFQTKPVFVKIANTFSAQLNSNNLVMENTLVAPNILYWLLGQGVSSTTEGQAFLSSYGVEEQWRDYE